jgi:hypothetical protein
MANLREAFEYASQNPDSDFAKNLEQLASSGALNEEAKKYNIDLSLFQPKTETSTMTQKQSVGDTGLKGIADFTGGKELSQGLGQAIAQPKISKQIEQTQSDQMRIQGDLINRIREKRVAGEDTSRLEIALKNLTGEIQTTGDEAVGLLNQADLTDKQVIGDALQLATTVASIGALKGASAGKLPAVEGVIKSTTKSGAIGKGALQGMKTGAISGGAFGSITGTSQALQEDKDAKGIIEDTAKGGILGATTGLVLGGITGAISGGLKGRQLRKAVLDNKNIPAEKTTQFKQKAIEIAKQQGIDDTDIKFISSMNKPDRIKAEKMIDLAEKASTDKRVIERPIDIVGDSMVDRVKFIQSQNSKAGKLVDQTAKSLKGQNIDATPVRERALSLLEDAGVFANPDGTPNWSKSVFNKTPDIKNKIMRAFSDLPAGEMDAYDLHNFKKSIDEVVNYGVKGEGLKGKSATILKSVRNTADEILDNSFMDYNKANTDYKNTKEVLEIANDLFGKKVGVVKERGGQLLRSVFSNNTQRPRVLSLVEKLDEVARQYGAKFDDNLVDQALFTEILEDVYGTQATTSLQGQVQRAVSGGQRVVEGLRNPIKGAGDVLATIAEKTAGITPENKKKILSALLK